MDIHSHHILTSKIVSRNIGEVKFAIEHLYNLNQRFDLKKLITIYDRGYESLELMIYTMFFDSKFLIRLNSLVFRKKISQMNSNDEIIQINISKRILKKIKDNEVREYAEKIGRIGLKRVFTVKIFKTEAKNMKDTHSSEEINEWYGNQIEEIINTSLDDILTVYKVIL